MKKNILKIRYGNLWTAHRAFTINTPYLTAHGNTMDGKCPICHMANDTAGHWLGSCDNPKFKSYYISRHNKAVCLIQETFFNGSKGGCYTIMDATAESDTPDGVARTRIPSWMLPSIPICTLLLLRPGILIIDGLTENDIVGKNLHDPIVLAEIQKSCTIHIIELGYTFEACYTTSMAKKHMQHIRLYRSLISAGWTVFSPNPALFNIILLGTAGTIFKPFHATMIQLGISNHHAIDLMNKLHIHAVRFADSIIRLRHTLEWSANCFLFDPP